MQLFFFFAYQLRIFDGNEQTVLEEMRTHKSTHICKPTKPNTKANLQKSGFFLRFLDTPNVSGHINYIDTPKEGRTYNMELGKIRADVSRVSTFCFSI